MGQDDNFGGLSRRPESRWGRRRTIRRWLTYLVVACVCPVWLLAGVAIYHAYDSKRRQIEQTTLNASRDLTLVVDRELANIQSSLVSLATSPALEAGDFARFHRHARDVLRNFGDADLILADRSGQQLVNSYLPFGQPLPRRRNMETVNKVFLTGRPVVTGLFKGSVTGRSLIGIDIPVILEGRIVYDLGMTVPIDRFSSLLHDQHLPDDWIGTIIDDHEIVVARTRLAENFVGHATREDAAAIRRGRSDGLMTVRNLEDVAVLEAFSRSSISGWSVVIGVPMNSLYAEIGRWLTWTVAIGVGFSAIGIGLALVMGRVIARSIRSLIGPALALGRGEKVSVAPLAFEETNQLGEALNAAFALLQERAAAAIEADKRANTDDLTGAASRRHFFDLAEQEFARSVRYDLPLAVLMMDVDHFKIVNDRFGHGIGDKLLAHLVDTLACGLRETDIVGRVGGEEFAVLLPHTDDDGAAALAERLRDRICRAVLVTDGRQLSCTISIGIGLRTPDVVSFDNMLRKADEALYRAKADGRNRVVLATGTSSCRLLP
jgi:diguanylate cyclase (GGDEF)-like protein